MRRQWVFAAFDVRMDIVVIVFSFAGALAFKLAARFTCGEQRGGGLLSINEASLNDNDDLCSGFS